MIGALTVNNRNIFRSLSREGVFHVRHLTLYALRDSSFWSGIIDLGQFIVYFEGTLVRINKKYVSLSMKIFFCLRKHCTVDPDEMFHFAVFHLVFTVCQGVH